MKLIKTFGGNNGAPMECNQCGAKHFGKTDMAWHCITCGIYQPTALGFNTIKENIEKAYKLLEEHKKSLEQLERLVKE